MKGLPEDTTDDVLRGLFAPFGAVLSATAPQDSYGKARGYGFVTYGSVEEATKAVSQMHLHVLSGHTIHVDLAESKQDREKRAQRLQQRDMRAGLRLRFWEIIADETISDLFCRF